MFRRQATTMILFFLAAMTYTVLVELSIVDLSFGSRPPLAYQLLLPSHFAGPMLGGMIFSSKSLSGRRALLVFLPLIPPAILAILTTGRTAIIAPILFWVASSFSIRVLLSRGRMRIFTVRRVLNIMALVFLVSVIGIGFQMFRFRLDRSLSPRERIVFYRDTILSGEAFFPAWYTVRSNILGNVYLFSYYFVSAWANPPSPQWGSIIFAAPLDLLGLGGQRYPFEDFEADPGIFSNVYTMLRPPIDDFGLSGSLIWWFLIGIVQGWAHQRIRRGSLLPCLLLVWFYVDVMIVGGFFFRYNSIILSYVFAGLYLISAGRTLSRRSVMVLSRRPHAHGCVLRTLTYE